MLSIGSIVIRVDDLPAQMAFWQAALGFEPRHDPEDDFVILQPPGGSGTCISLDRVPSSVHIPPCIHLDLYTEDQSGEVQRLLDLGATRVEWSKRPADADFVIMADPEGNRFCAIDTAGRGDAQRSETST
ncbi:VOC family protein [Arthrobacter sp. LjRoot14]|uniref:VOC family protein n=1 Tax=Arthrobacter sp. LjRoot14 TaxID=3342265 RepID=UPI003ECFC8A1